jgi:WD40 repeat protein
MQKNKSQYQILLATPTYYEFDLEYVLCLKKNKYENYFVSAGDDKTVMIWDLKTGKPVNFILAHSSSITSVDIFEDSSVILTTSDEGYR